jgi:hypothetical protein
MPAQQFLVSIAEFRNRQTVIPLSLLVRTAPVTHEHCLQVGIAAMNLKRPELLLWQYSDNTTYSNTMMLLNSFDPQEVTRVRKIVCEAVYPH